MKNLLYSPKKRKYLNIVQIIKDKDSCFRRSYICVTYGAPCHAIGHQILFFIHQCSFMLHWSFVIRFTPSATDLRKLFFTLRRFFRHLGTRAPKSLRHLDSSSPRSLMGTLSLGHLRHFVQQTTKTKAEGFVAKVQPNQLQLLAHQRQTKKSFWQGYSK